MAIILPSNHFTLISGNFVDQICQPLKLLGITCFNYTRLYANDSTLQLTNRPLFLKDFYANGLYASGCFEYANQEYLPGYILSSTLDDAAQPVFTFAREYHDIDHVLTISKKNQENWEFYHFGGPRNFVALPGFYLSNIDLLEKFILHFQEKAQKLIIQANKQRIYHSINRAPNLTEKKGVALPLATFSQQTSLRKQFLEQLSTKRFPLVACDQKIILTKREMDCLRELFKGYPAREIGQRLCVSSRTVETHIVHIKDKLQCDTKTQLIDKLRQNNFELLTRNF